MCEEHEDYTCAHCGEDLDEDTIRLRMLRDLLRQGETYGEAQAKVSCQGCDGITKVTAWVHVRLDNEMFEVADNY
jgi:hypothetical protein